MKKNFRSGNLIMLALLGLGFLFACNDNDDDKNIQPQNVQVNTISQDKEFVMKAGYANRAEIDLAQLALSQANNDSVKAYAQFMINEHTLAQNELKSIAAPKNISVPDTLDAAHKTLKQQFMNMSGTQFDSAYIQLQIQDHQKTQQDFQTEINEGKDTDIKNYSNKYLPHINMHLQKAQQIQNMIQ